MFFLKEGKSDHSVRCIKSRIMNKVIDYVLSIDTCEKQCVFLKGMLQSPQLKYHVQTVSIHPSLTKMLYMNTNVLKKSKNYTNKLVSVTNNNNPKTFLRLVWFLILKDSLTKVLYLPGYQHWAKISRTDHWY